MSAPVFRPQRAERLTRLRVRCVAATALALPGACGDDGRSTSGGSTDGVTVSEARITAVMEAVCRHWSTCDEQQNFGENYASIQDCTEALEADFPGADQQDCADARLDYTACAADLACGESADRACTKFGEAMNALCQYG